MCICYLCENTAGVNARQCLVIDDSQFKSNGKKGWEKERKKERKKEKKRERKKRERESKGRETVREKASPLHKLTKI